MFNTGVKLKQIPIGTKYTGKVLNLILSVQQLHKEAVKLSTQNFYL